LRLRRHSIVCFNISQLFKKGVISSPLFLASITLPSVAVAEEGGQELALSAISSFFELQNMKQVGGIAIVRGDKPVGEVELEMAKALGERIASKLT